MDEILGPALQSKLNQFMTNQFMFQGVTQDADVSGDIALGTPGRQVATSLIDQWATQCPDMKMFVSGTVKGPWLLIKGLPLRTSESKVKAFCAKGDEVCNEMFITSAAHLSYVGVYIDTGAEWVQQVATESSTAFT
jgi:hypothetical protein